MPKIIVPIVFREKYFSVFPSMEFQYTSAAEIEDKYSRLKRWLEKLLLGNFRVTESDGTIFVSSPKHQKSKMNDGKQERLT
ncbi:hypothetical protein CEXT_286811 [Caerostris extrusa]|uniref:Uncharacterized protein n=1 Tax=Caerostris extrusa TaxID=172846 RepID=A0AAV4TF75_CAEEX|nr:hypothetical protein CEXT_286811 [Caerostris extrusa]